MNDTNPIIYACKIVGDGFGELLTEQTAPVVLKSHELAWVHLDRNHNQTKNWLNEHVPYLDSIIVEALLADETRPRIVEHENGVLLILRGVNLNENAQPEDMISIRVWVDPERIITLRRRPLKAALDLQERLSQGKGPKDAGEFICALSSLLFQRMEPSLVELDERLDNIEEIIMDSPDVSERQAITNIRKQAIMFRRYMAPQKDVIAQLRLSELPWLEQSHKRRLQESADRIVRYVEDLDAMRERAQIVKDELANAIADKLNRNMYVLSIVAAIFLPLGFLTGLLGINVGGMPGADNDTAFWIVCLLCLGFSSIIIAVFKWLKWL